MAIFVLVACRSQAPSGGLFQAHRFVESESLGEEIRQVTFAQEELSASQPEHRQAWLALGERLKALALQRPDQVMIQRQWDDFERESLRGPAVWIRRHAALERNVTAKRAYLLGRLERAERGKQLFRTAMNLDPGFAMGYHGSAWLAGQTGDYDTAEYLGQLAAARASSLSQALVVGTALLHFRQATGKNALAIKLLAEMRELPGLIPRVSARLLAQELAFELKSAQLDLLLNTGIAEKPLGSVLRSGRRSVDRAWLDALALLDADSALVDVDIAPLLNAIDVADLGRPRDEKLGAALVAIRARTGLVAKRLKQWLARELRLLEVARPLAPGPGFARQLDAEEFASALDFEKGRTGKWLADWRRRLPNRLQGLKVEAESSMGALFMTPALVALAGDPGLVDQPDPTMVAQLFFEAGWFRAAHQVAARQLEDATDLLARIESGRLLVAELGRIFEAAKIGQIDGLSGSGSVLEAVRELASRFVPGLEADAPELLSSEAIETSSMETYGPFAGLIQPGPRLSARSDSALLPGFAALLTQLGRVAIVGSQFGDLDATMRPVIAKQYLLGEHLGAPFSGTAFWCQGVDISSRVEGARASIAGAAVHDGFWIDIEVVRNSASNWRAVARDYSPLLTREGSLFAPAPDGGRNRADLQVPLLGEGQRLMLELIAERGPATFDELIELVVIHEEAHLCDRARFLPLADNWPAALDLLAKVGFRPDQVIQRLEYRAELVTLCEAEEPRLVLTEILLLAENAEASATTAGSPHGVAYSMLLADLQKEAAISLDPERYLRWQWHQISAQDLRSAALRLAANEGLIVVD